jgi:hypothetical protein
MPVISIPRTFQRDLARRCRVNREVELGVTPGRLARAALRGLAEEVETLATECAARENSGKAD